METAARPRPTPPALKKRIAIVDDDPKLGHLFATVLQRDGYDARAFGTPQGFLDTLDTAPPDLVLTDLQMPGLSGTELLQTLKMRGLDVPVIIMTGHSSVRSAVEAMQMGALHYLQKPVNLEEMRALLARALDLYDAQQELAQIRSGERSRYAPSALVGEGATLARVRETLRTLRNAPDTTVLIRGETGTGKNLVARMLHHASARHAGRFLEIHAASLPEASLDGVLFGIENEQTGLLEAAEGGTLFLDEVAALSPLLQQKLATVLETRTFRRVNGLEEVHVNTRLVCTTSADLEALVSDGRFRQDLFYRIHVVTLALPPLRTLGPDVLAIARALLDGLARDLARPVHGFTPDAEAALAAYPWPGNVRELRNVLERALIFSSTPLVDVGALALASAALPRPADAPYDGFVFPDGGTLDALERAYLEYTFARSDASLADLAAQLGISKKTLWDKRKRYGLDDKRVA